MYSGTHPSSCRSQKYYQNLMKYIQDGPKLKVPENQQKMQKSPLRLIQTRIIYKRGQAKRYQSMKWQEKYQLLNLDFLPLAFQNQKINKEYRPFNSFFEVPNFEVVELKKSEEQYYRCNTQERTPKIVQKKMISTQTQYDDQMLYNQKLLMFQSPGRLQMARKHRSTSDYFHMHDQPSIKFVEMIDKRNQSMTNKVQLFKKMAYRGHTYK